VAATCSFWLNWQDNVLKNGFIVTGGKSIHERLAGDGSV
jgi:hypothetical protein